VRTMFLDFLHELLVGIVGYFVTLLQDIITGAVDGLFGANG